MTPARSLLIALVAVALCISVRPVAAEQFPRGLLASARRDTCQIETRPLNFGTYNPLEGTRVDAVGEVIYTCTTERPNGKVRRLRVELSEGKSGAYETRWMTAGLSVLFYNVYLDAVRQTVWGDGSRGTDYYQDKDPPDNRAVTVPVYGRIYTMQDAEAGDNTDLLQVMINF